MDSLVGELGVKLTHMERELREKERDLRLIEERLREHIGEPRSKGLTVLHLLSEVLGQATLDRGAKL